MQYGGSMTWQHGGSMAGQHGDGQYSLMELHILVQARQQSGLLFFLSMLLLVETWKMVKYILKCILANLEGLLIIIIINTIIILHWFWQLN